VETSWKFLAKINAIPPQAWDAIIPKGRVHERLLDRVGEMVTLNPQPLPPHESVIGARLVQSLTSSAIIVVGGREAGAAGSALLEEIDDWCGTGWPRRWPRPRPPEGWDDGMVFAGAALAAAQLADQYEHVPEMQDALGAAASRLAEQAVAH
jgi:hypothetical protein